MTRTLKQVHALAIPESANWIPRVVFLHCIAALLCVGNIPAIAGSLAVSPLRLVFASGTGIASITVENNGLEEALVQTETFTWRQVDGEHKLSPTDDVIAVPPVFRLAPNAKQIIRVGLTRPIGDPQEQTYRLTVAEVPTALTPGAVAVVVRHSLPIFVRPSSPIAPHLTAKLDASGGVSILNNGSQHLRINRWRVRDRSGIILAENEGPGYLLAGAGRVLGLARKDISRLAVFEADTGLETLKITVGQ